MGNVRIARPADRPVVARTVAAAFANDPAWTFFFGDRYDQLADHFAGVLFDLRVGRGTVWVIDDLAAVAMWDSPVGTRPMSVEAEQMREAFGALAGATVSQRLSDYGRALSAVHPSTPYWYLAVLATSPDRQSQGLGTAVMAPVLERADRDGIDCCLDTSTVRNRDFYQRRGFIDVTSVQMAAGPSTWWLHRSASHEWFIDRQLH